MKDFFVHQNQDCSVLLGGVMSLINFAVDNIVVRVKGGLIEVSGRNLIIKRFDENEMIIVGKINGVLTNVSH
ncbi:MAG: YabP/YqfC family sporulation protein [Clostridia bacterium]|nr:YabP/YqfC family sporulation protein [Clostridia bacterium]